MSTGGAWAYSNNTLAINTWHHVAVSYVSSTRTVTFYINGVADGTFTYANNIYTGSTSNVFIGRQGYGCVCNFFNGSMDEVRIWNVARTCDQLQSTKDRELVGNETGLLAYYNFNQGIASGTNTGLTTLTDLAGTADNGTLTNFALTGATSNWVSGSGNGVFGNTPVAQPEINVQGNGTSIPDGDITPIATDHTSFGIVPIGGSLARTYTIQNTGGAALTISSIASNNAKFVVSGEPTTVAASSAATFTVTYTPTVIGADNATITINNSDCDEAIYDFAVEGTAIIVTWDGTGWNNGTGPAAPLETIIASTTPNQPPSFEAKNLTLNAGADWVIGSGITAIVNGVLNYSGNITVQSGGSLVQAEGSTLGTVSGVFKAQRSVSNPALTSTITFAYNYWGSPVQAQPASTLTAISYRRRYTFHEPTAAWRNSDNGITSLINVAGEAKFYTNFISSVHRLVPGVGYTSASNQTSFTREFTGLPNNGNIAVNTSRLSTGSSAGYNLMGNPYASAILIADNDAGTTGLLEDAVNADFEASAYVFTDSEDGKGTGSLRVVNAAGAQGNHVASMQGFFVTRKAAPVATSGNLTFRNLHRVGGNNTDPNFYRGEATGIEHFSLIVRRTDRVADNVALALADNFSDAYENGRDARKLDANSELNLAARWNGERLAQLAIGKKERLEIPLLLNTTRTGEHVFAAENLPTATTLPLFLEDRATGEFYYLQAGREHKINIAAGQYENRFFIRTVDEAAKGAQATGTQVFSHGRELFVKANGNGGTLRIFNLMGTELWKVENVQASGLARFTVPVQLSGIYVVKYTDAQGSTEAKVWLEK